MRQQRAWLFGILLLAVIGSVFLLVFFRGWIREAVVLPVAYLFWILGLLLRSIDQAVYWGILIVFGFIVTFYVLWPEPVKGDPEKPVERGRIHSRYYQWFSYYHHLDESSFAGDSLARELVRLTVQILSYQQNVSPDEIYRQIDEGQISLPDEFVAFLRRREFMNKPIQRPAWQDFINQLFHRGPQVHRPDQLSPLEQEAESILHAIETLLTPQETFTEVTFEQPAPQHADS